MPFPPVSRSIPTMSVAAAMLAASSLASAERLIDVPTARKLPFGTFRLEYADQLSADRTQLGYFDAGIGTSFEADLRTEQLTGRPFAGTIDLTYNYISPLSGISPGIAFGVQDALNATQDGRRFFFCITYRDQADAIGGDFPTEVTIGTFIANRTSPYLGITIPFSGNVRLLAEHDGIRISAGLEYRPIRPLGLRLLARGRDLMGDLSWSGHF